MSSSTSSSSASGQNASASYRKSSGGEIVSISCGNIANWMAAQYFLLQNSNNDVHTPFQRSTHFRRTGEGSNSEGAWTPRLLALDASVGLDSVVATYGAQESASRAHAAQDKALAAYKAEVAAMDAGGSGVLGASTLAAKAASSVVSGRPKHWSDLSKKVWNYHSKSLYSMPGLYEGTSDFHLHEQGTELMARESVHEEVLDRVRWFLEECDAPDGIHLLVEANSGWSGVGSTLLHQLRDEYEKIPIFCVSALLPPPPSSVLGTTFASATPLVQSAINSSLLLNTATQMASAYLPLTTHFWNTSAAAASIVPAPLQKALARGEIYESATLLALQLHLCSTSYRAHPRSLNMATALGGLTQQSQANVLAYRFLTKLDLETQSTQASEHFDSRESSSESAVTPTIHTLPSAVPVSMLGHWHAYPASKIAASFEPYASAAVAASISATAGSSVLCDRNCALTESVHVFGNTDELSHEGIKARMSAQSPALYRSVVGSSRLNLPPSFPLHFHDMLEEGSASSLYRCQTLGSEMRQLGQWLASLNRGSVMASSYVQTEGRALESAPSFLLNPHRKPRNAGDATTERAEQFQLSFTQEQIDEISECGVSLQNLAELY